MCPVSVEMLKERFLQPSGFGSSEDPEETQTEPSHAHLWLSALAMQSASLYDLQSILSVYFLVGFFFFDRLLNGNTKVSQYKMFSLIL